MELVYIYCLIDPIDKQIKYIGKTNNVKNRLYTHLSNCNLIKNTPKNSWIKKLKLKKLKPILEILDEVNFKDWEFWEIYYISLYKSWGFNLKNYTNGGEGNNCKIRTQEHKDKISKKLKGRKPSYIITEEIKNKMSLSQKKTYQNGRVSNLKIKDKLKGLENWKKKIIQYDLNMNFIREYNSINEASIELNNKNAKGNICSACKNGNKAYKYYWKYK